MTSWSRVWDAVAHLACPVLPFTARETDVIISLRHVCLNDVRAPYVPPSSIEPLWVEQHGQPTGSPSQVLGRGETDHPPRTRRGRRCQPTTELMEKIEQLKRVGRGRWQPLRRAPNWATGSWDQSILVLDDHHTVAVACSFQQFSILSYISAASCDRPPDVYIISLFMNIILHRHCVQLVEMA